MNDKNDKPNTKDYFATKKFYLNVAFILAGLILIVVVFRKVKNDYTVN